MTPEFAQDTSCKNRKNFLPKKQIKHTHKNYIELGRMPLTPAAQLKPPSDKDFFSWKLWI
jgi:hypothetical protein